MSILHRATSRSSDRLNLPTNAEVIDFMDMIRGESIDELGSATPVPAADAATQAAALELDKNVRPWEYIRRQDETALSGQIIGVLHQDGGA